MCTNPFKYIIVLAPLFVRNSEPGVTFRFTPFTPGYSY